MNEQEMIIEDTDIREALNDIYTMLADLPKEERFAFFAQISKPKELDFVREIDGIYYVVCSHFDKDNKEDMVKKVNRILNKDV